MALPSKVSRSGAIPEPTVTVRMKEKREDLFSSPRLDVRLHVLFCAAPAFARPDSFVARL